MIYDAIVVGGGASGLTAAAYLAKSGHSTLLLEKEPRCGGLINSFTKDGFTFDVGIRALENAGVLLPMLKNLGIELDLVPNPVSLGIEDQVITVKSAEDLSSYEALLKNLYPESKDEISAIISDIQQITRYMDIQYGINNPLFLDIKEDRDYFIKNVLPWMFKYMLTVPKVVKKDQPVVPYLEKFTTNPSLIDLIAQHFFTNTPAYFALSYFRLYQDYFYPKGGTGTFIQALISTIQDQGGEIQTNTQVTGINLDRHTLRTATDQEYQFRTLLWTGDQKTLYQAIDVNHLSDQNTRDAVNEKRAFLADKVGNDSVMSLYALTNLDKSYFEAISKGHFFYTPSRAGQSKAGSLPIGGTWEEIRTWLEKYYALTTYEISIPVLRDSKLAPAGKTGLIISTLFSYPFIKFIAESGWLDQFKGLVGDLIINNLDKSIYPGLAHSVFDRFISTPLTIQKRTGSTDGAITGWSFTNHPMPAENRLVKISNAVMTPLPGVFQAGQWTYSPSGLPVSLITGKVAADKIHKTLK